MISCVDAGCLPYDQALLWQKSLAERRRKGEIKDSLLLLEHPPVYTMGKRDSFDDLLASEEWLRQNGMKIYKTDRGGRVTYHGPGQLIGYLIFSLKGSLPDFVWKMEEAIIRLLARYDLEGERDAAYPGVWLDKKKIAALGLHLEKGVTTHGFSLNVNCDLKPFRYIHPCGIKDREVTSLEKELGWRPSMKDVKERFLREFAEVFGSSVFLEGTAPAPPE